MEFEKIKSRIELYKLSSLVLGILDMLNDIQRKKDVLYPFWKLLVLLKWSYRHTSDKKFLRRIKKHEIGYLLGLIENFETKYDALDFTNPEAVSKSFRIIAYQQFAYQETFYNSILERQLVLFTKLTTSFDAAREFEKHSGIEMITFWKCCYLTHMYLNKADLTQGFYYDGIFHKDYFDLCKYEFSREELNAFWSLLTITKSSDFQGLQKLKDERLQLFETNFFITKPFIFFNGQYRILHHAIFTQTIKHFVYTYLKAMCPNTFPDDFGKRLERYIELGLKENKIPYKNESALKKHYKLTKVVDFKIDDNILIECKASELHARSGVLRLPNILTNELSSSIIKAYCQLLATASVINKENEWLGIIVTYREMFLGFGNDAWNEFMKEPIEQFCAANEIDIAILPPENLFFIPVEYWDYMMQVVKEGRAIIKEILMKAKADNSSPKTKVMLLEQILTRHFKVDSLQLSYLTDVHQLLDFPSFQ